MGEKKLRIMSKCIVLLAPGFEEIEALAVVDILRRGEVLTTIAGTINGMITGRNNMTIIPDEQIQSINVTSYDMLVIPGGLGGVESILADSTAMKLIMTMFSSAKYIAAICAAPKILAKLGLLKDKVVTSYPSEKMNILNDVKLYSEEKVVIDGNIITSRGPGTAIEFGLTLLSVLNGNDVSQNVRDKILADPM